MEQEREIPNIQPWSGSPQLYHLKSRLDLMLIPLCTSFFSHIHNTLLYNLPHSLTYIQIPAWRTPSPPNLLKCPLLNNESYPDHHQKGQPHPCILYLPHPIVFPQCACHLLTYDIIYVYISFTFLLLTRL